MVSFILAGKTTLLSYIFGTSRTIDVAWINWISKYINFQHWKNSWYSLRSTMGIWYNHGVHCTFMHWTMLLLSLMAVLMGFIVLSCTGKCFYYLWWQFSWGSLYFHTLGISFITFYGISWGQMKERQLTRNINSPSSLCFSPEQD